MQNQQEAIARAKEFEKRAAAMRLNLSILTSWLDEMAPKPEDATWATIGDLGRVNDQLDSIIEFLGRDNY